MDLGRVNHTIYKNKLKMTKDLNVRPEIINLLRKYRTFFDINGSHIIFWGEGGSVYYDSWVGKIPWRRERLPTPVFWPGEFHGLYSS